MADALPPLSDDDLQRLEEAARAAPDGDWSAYIGNEYPDAVYIPAFSTSLDGTWHGPTLGGDWDAADSISDAVCAHIATADPQTVLRLVAEVRRLRAALTGQP